MFRITDFNQDGRPDLVVRTESGITVLPGIGDGTFATPVLTPFTHEVESVTAADFDGDGKLDLAVASFTDSAVYILLGQGNGTFVLQGSLSVPKANWIEAADLDGDGHPDLIVESSPSYVDGGGQAWQRLTLFPGIGGGGFHLPGTVIRSGGFLGPITVADLNGDQRPDLVVANQVDFWVQVLLNQGPAVGAQNRVELTWPTATSGFVLERNTDVSGPWTAVPATPLIAHGPANTVQVDRGANQQFFRLRKAP